MLMEKIDNLIVAHAVINLNKYKIISDKNEITATLRHSELRPFVFLNNKN